MGRYEQAVVLVACSAVVQMFAEVPWLLAQVFQFVRQVSKSSYIFRSAGDRGLVLGCGRIR